MSFRNPAATIHSTKGCQRGALENATPVAFEELTGIPVSCLHLNISAAYYYNLVKYKLVWGIII